jgi:hypothetical protein
MNRRYYLPVMAALEQKSFGASTQAVGNQLTCVGCSSTTNFSGSPTDWGYQVLTPGTFNSWSTISEK